MAPQTPQLCITGGEPTLYFEGLLEIIRAVKERLPRTALHMLSNGRLFGRRGYAKAIASLGHPDFAIGIPLYSDEPAGHDYVVQSKGAFDETVLGLLNLARHGQKVEIRFVIPARHFQDGGNCPVHRQKSTLCLTCRSDGLEPTGFARTNLEALWVDPWEYQSQLEEAVEILRAARLRTSIYNHPALSDSSRALADCDAIDIRLEEHLLGTVQRLFGQSSLLWFLFIQPERPQQTPPAFRAGKLRPSYGTVHTRSLPALHDSAATAAAILGPRLRAPPASAPSATPGSKT